MAKKDHTVRYTAEEMRAMVERGEGKSDWARAEAKTYEQIEADIASDPDESGDWSSSITETARPILTMPIDVDVLKFFGADYQTKISALLRSYVDHARHQDEGRVT